MRPYGAGGRQSLHERAKGHTQTEDRPAATTTVSRGATIGGCPVEESVGGLYQPGPREVAVRRVKVVQSGQRAYFAHLEDGATAANTASAAGPARPCRAVEDPVGGLQQPERRTAIGAGQSILDTKAVERR